MKPSTFPPMADRPWFRHGALGSALLVALVMLAVFHAVVAGAVERAASRRAEAGERSTALASATAVAPGRSRPVELARLGN